MEETGGKGSREEHGQHRGRADILSPRPAVQSAASVHRRRGEAIRAIDHSRTGWQRRFRLSTTDVAGRQIELRNGQR